MGFKIYFIIAEVYNLAKAWIGISNVQSWRETELAEFYTCE
jgi:hypothetical protein